MMNRREFLKWMAGLSASVISITLLPPVSAAPANSELAPGSYGSGVYGQAAYAGYQVFVPLVQRGGK
jgi:hypothetical protein